MRQVSIKLKKEMARVKTLAFELRGKYQIPIALLDITYKVAPSDVYLEEKCKWLIFMFKQYMRVKGFYKEYIEAEKYANKEIRKAYEKLLIDIDESMKQKVRDYINNLGNKED